MATTTISIRLPNELAEQLDILAGATRRTKSFCAVEAIQRYVEKESWQVQAIEEGLEDAEKCRMVNHSDVREWVASWDSLDEKRPPK